MSGAQLLGLRAQRALEAEEETMAYGRVRVAWNASLRQAAGRSCLLAVSVLVALAVTALQSAANAQLNPGDVLVVDADGGGPPPLRGVLFAVDAATGVRTVVSDFNDGSQGPLGSSPFGVAVGGSGEILVTDAAVGTSGRGALFVVDPTTGMRTVVSDFGQGAQGPVGLEPFGIAVGGAGEIWVIDPAAGSASRGALFIVDSTTGTRTVVSDFGQGVQGPLGVDPLGIAVGGSGEIWVIDPAAGNSSRGALFIVDSTTGLRTVVSDFGQGAQGPLGLDPIGIAVGGAGWTLVADANSGASAGGALFGVDTATGIRSLVSDFGQSSQGPQGLTPFGVAIGASGEIFVIDADLGLPRLRGALFTVDATTGDRVLLSDFGDALQGPLGGHPTGLAIVPELVLQISVDIQPGAGSERNAIHPERRGVITVAILATSLADGDEKDFDPFDAADPVDPSTLVFGPDGAGIVHATGHAADADGDGDIDLVLHFQVQETGIACGETEATLNGATSGGRAIEGSDAIVTVGCG